MPRLKLCSIVQVGKIKGIIVLQAESELLAVTRLWLNNRNVTLKKISEDTGLSLRWLYKLRNGDMTPTVENLENLYKYLANIERLNLPSPE